MVCKPYFMEKNKLLFCQKLVNLQNLKNVTHIDIYNKINNNMQNYLALWYHLVWSTKNRELLIDKS